VEYVRSVAWHLWVRSFLEGLKADGSTSSVWVRPPLKLGYLVNPSAKGIPTPMIPRQPPHKAGNPAENIILNHAISPNLLRKALATS
jgi:hypothetical protein